jgi:hypothetical protein
MEKLPIFIKADNAEKEIEKHLTNNSKKIAYVCVVNSPSLPS